MGYESEASDEMQSMNFLLAGVGGQGVLVAAGILADVGLLAGYDVKQSEIHGMAQRGGSVTSHVRWGRRVDAPMAGRGEVDVLLGFEQLETLRYVEYLRPEGRAFISTHKILPISVTSGGAHYPDLPQVTGAVEQVTHDYLLVPAVDLAGQAGNARAHNVVLLGALSAALALEPATWLEAMRRHVPAKALAVNERAFELGRQARVG